jgi:polyketide biosynthesis enoyl-CoA hydratase PksI
MSSWIKVKTERAGITEVIMDDPRGKNYLGPELCEGLFHCLEEIKREPSLRVVLLRGNTNVFSGGAPREVLEGIFGGQIVVKDADIPMHMLRFPLPIIAVLEGSAVGGGLTLALCCDITVAAENQRYGSNFADMGFTPALGTTTILPTLVGWDFAAEMMMTAKPYKARELHGRGLFTHILPSAEVYPKALEIACRIAEKERHVLELLKQTLATPRLQALQPAMLQEHLMHQLCFSRPETERIIKENYLDQK